MILLSYENFFPKSRRSQLTIFIIAGIVLVTGILLFFLVRNGLVQETASTDVENPETFMEFCLDNKVKEAINFISLRGGYIDSKLSTEFRFQNEPARNITFLCYNKNSYLPCVNQKPAFSNDLKTEIKKYISQDVEECFNEMISSFERDGFNVQSDYNGFEVNIIPNRVVVETSSDLSLEKAGENTNYNDLTINVASKLYEISFFVQEIVNQEARFCYAEISGIMLTYPDFIIDRAETQNLGHIYSIEHADSKEKFRFAVRSCAIPPGV